MFDQLEPLALHCAQLLNEDFKAVLSLQEHAAFALDQVSAGEGCKLGLDAGA